MSYICHCLSFISSRRHGEVFPHKHLSATTTKYLPLAFSETKQLLKHFILIPSGLSLFITFNFAENGAFAVRKADFTEGWNRQTDCSCKCFTWSVEGIMFRSLYDKLCAKLYNDIIGGRVQLTINVLHVMWCVMNCHDTHSLSWGHTTLGMFIYFSCLTIMQSPQNVANILVTIVT